MFIGWYSASYREILCQEDNFLCITEPSMKGVYVGDQLACIFKLNPLTAAAAYIRVLIFY